jgi:hypothetical protein
MLGAVGRETRRSVSYPIAVSDIRRWDIAVYYPEEQPRLFWDEAYAATTVHGGIVAPEDFNPFAWMAAEPVGLPETIGGYDPDQTEKTLGVTAPGLQNLLNGGMETEYGVRMRPGDVITSVSRLAGYKEREGRLGLMLFTNSETVGTNQGYEFVKRNVGTLILY